MRNFIFHYNMPMGFICLLVMVLLKGCASAPQRRNGMRSQTESATEGPSGASILSRVQDRKGEGMSQIFATTQRNGSQTIQTWCSGVRPENEPVVKRELTKSGLCFRRICDLQKCEDYGNAFLHNELPKKNKPTIAH